MNRRQRAQEAAGFPHPAPSPCPPSFHPPGPSIVPGPPPPRGLDPALTASAREWLLRLDAAPVALRLRVVWNSRLQTTAGTASLRECRIDLNPRLRDIGPEQIDRTLRHEAAHLLAGWRAGRRRIQTHGPEWRAACADLGIPGEPACHNLPFPRRRLEPKFFYQCPGCGLIVRRVRRLKRNTACFRCCRFHNGGKYDARFRFFPIDAPPPPEAGTEGEA